VVFGNERFDYPKVFFADRVRVRLKRRIASRGARSAATDAFWRAL